MARAVFTSAAWLSPPPWRHANHRALDVTLIELLLHDLLEATGVRVHVLQSRAFRTLKRDEDTTDIGLRREL